MAKTHPSVCIHEDDWGGMKAEMKNVQKDVSEIKMTLSSIDKKIDALDNKYASKLTEKIVYAMCGIILAAVLGALIYLVVK